MSKIKSVFGWILPIIIGLSLAFVIKTFLISTATVQGTSMYPNLVDKELVFLLKQAKLRRGSVVIFDAYGVDKNRADVNKDTKYVKRIIGTPGDSIRYNSNGILYVNGKEQSQSYINKEQQTNGTLNLQLKPAKGVEIGNNKEFKVPKDNYFVLGDNRAVSNDGRYYGFVPKNKILGVAKVPVWQKHYKEINSFEP